MKLLILGISMLITGFIGFAILCGSAVINDHRINDSSYFMNTWYLLGVTPIAVGFLLFGIAGVIISVIGVCQKDK